MSRIPLGRPKRSVIAASSAVAMLFTAVLGAGAVSARETSSASSSAISQSAAAMVADAASIGESSGDKKNEVVYVKASADGASQGVYVVNEFNTGKTVDIDDPSDYTKVTNLTTNQRLEQRDGRVSLTTTADQPFYYQGDMPSDTILPWNITLTYALDGKTVDPEDLAGKSGSLDVTLAINANDDDAVKDFAESYVLQAQGTFAQDAYDITGSDATLAMSGSNTIVSAMVLPGESKTFHIHGKARDFQYSGWQIAAMNLDMAIDLGSQDTSKLSEQTEALENATTQLADGSA